MNVPNPAIKFLCAYVYLKNGNIHIIRLHEYADMYQAASDCKSIQFLTNDGLPSIFLWEDIQKVYIK